MNRQHNNTPNLALKQHLMLGLVAWVLLGGLTAVLDSQNAGLISLFGGIGAWLATGIGLALVYIAAFAAYQRRGWTAAGVAGGVSLAGVAVLVAVINWNTVMQAVLTLGGLGVFMVLVARSPSNTTSSDVSSSQEWRWGSQGPGWYSGDMLVWPDNPEEND